MEILNLTKDLAGIASQIYTKCWKIAYKGIIPQAYLDDLSAEQWTSSLENSKFENFLLKDNGSFIATSAISSARDSKYSGYGEIISIYVLPEHFGKGYGTVLFHKMTEKLQSMGLNNMYLWVLEENYQARKFYEKMGFQPNGDNKIANIGGKELTEICYVNHLP